MTVMIVLVVLVSSALLSSISYRRARNSVFVQSEANYSVAADKYAQELSAWIGANGAIVDTLATEIEVTKIYDQDRNRFHEYLFSSCERLNSEGYIYDIYFTFMDNTMACASDFVVDGTVDYVHDRDWFTTAAETKKLYYSTPYKDSDTGKAIITISKAVYDGEELKGVLAADIFVDTLVKIVSNAEVESDSYAFLVDQDMGMVIHPNPQYSFENEPFGILQISGSPYADVVANIRNNSKDTVYVDDYDGTTRGIVVAEVSNTGWHVGIATSKSAMMRGVDSLMRGFLIAAGVAVLIGATFAVVLAYVMDQHSKQQQEYEARVLKLEKQAADEASNAKSRFLADMSHEIRTPINAILGMNEMILRETDSKDIENYSKNIRQSGQNLLQLINSILDFSKIENGKMEIVPGRYVVKTQLRYIYNSIAERARAKDLDLILQIDPNLPSELFGDNMRINEIIMNLLTNAVKYTETGSVTLTIREKERRTLPDTASLLYVEVKDTGIGIKEEDMDKLFESFERLDVVRNRHIEGTGLGISVTTQLLELMDSKLEVASEYGFGSTFWFELWQQIEDSEPIGDFQAAILEEESEKVYRESFRAPDAHILIVDDTKMNIVVAVNLLKKTGVRISTALSGADAVRLCEENVFDLILMDQRMPVMDGTEAMKKIRELPGKKNEKTPIVCLTADVVRGARERYLAEGFDDYLTKPVDAEKLEKMLFTHLPKEKITMDHTKEEQSHTASSDSKLFDALTRAGVEIGNGLFFCSNDEEIYRSILSEYSLEHKIKASTLERCFAEKDWKNYEIHAHSLKSTSKTIGANRLYELAAVLENAAGSGDEMTLMEQHSKAMAMYGKIVTAIEENLDMVPATEEEEEEIFEFLPEGESDENEE